MIQLAGIDYSMSSPGICIYVGDGTKDSISTISNFSFHFITDRKKSIGTYRIDDQVKITGHEYPEWDSSTARFDFLSEWVSGLVRGCDIVNIEGYSYGSKGAALFEIGENTGVLKHKLRKQKTLFEITAPTSIKKFATGKGNSPKEDMYVSFCKDTGIDLLRGLGLSNEKTSPVSDIVDSYYLCKYQIDKSIKSF